VQAFLRPGRDGAVDKRDLDEEIDAVVQGVDGERGTPTGPGQTSTSASRSVLRRDSVGTVRSAAFTSIQARS
jgi:hypothetical protein